MYSTALFHSVPEIRIKQLSYVFRVDDVLEVLERDLPVLTDRLPEHVLKPLQVLLRHLRPGTAKKKHSSAVRHEAAKQWLKSNAIRQHW